MPLPGLLFPQTALGRSTYLKLWPLVRPILVLEPPGLAAEAGAPAWAAPDSLMTSRPPAWEGLDPKTLESLRRSWEQWLQGRQGSFEAEALKAGLSLPPEPETFRSLKREIMGNAAPAPPAPHPQTQAELFLALLHRQDQESGEMEDLLAQAQAAQMGLTQSLGQTLEDYQPVGYEQPFGGRLQPRDAFAEPEEKLARRLSAWASLAVRAPLGQPVWLVTASLPACQLLMERGNARLNPGGNAEPSLPLAQEVCHLQVPDLAGLAPSSLTQLDATVQAQGSLEDLRSALEALLARLAVEPWSQALKDEIAAQAQALAQDYATILSQALSDHDLPSRGLSLLAFPGLSPAQVLGLMQGQDPGPPQAAGSCPILAAW
jgi:hypothetical protein